MQGLSVATQSHTHYASALEHYPHSRQDAQVLFQCGLCYFYLRHWGQAVELLERSLELGDDPRVQDWLESARRHLLGK